MIIIPASQYWFSGTVWVAAIAFVLTAIISVLEVREILSTKPLKQFRVVLAIAVVISVFLAWWVAAVQEFQQQPRQLTKSEQDALVASLKPSEKLHPKVIVFHNMVGSEGTNYARQWSQVLNQAGWTVEEANGLTTTIGLCIQVKSADTKGAGDLQSAILTIGLKANAQISKELDEGAIKLIIGAKE